MRNVDFAQIGKPPHPGIGPNVQPGIHGKQPAAVGDGATLARWSNVGRTIGWRSHSDLGLTVVRPDDDSITVPYAFLALLPTSAARPLPCAEAVVSFMELTYCLYRVFATYDQPIANCLVWLLESII